MNSNLEANLLDAPEPKLATISTRTMLLCSVISILVMTLELIGGILSRSLVIMTDAINTLLDVSIFLIEYICNSLSISPYSKLSYGYYRIEILGFLMSIAIVWSLSIWLLYESIQKFFFPYPIFPDLMLISSSIGFLYNLVIWLLIGRKAVAQTKFKSIYINMKTKHTHFLMDLIESIVIICVSITLKLYPDLEIIDPICSILLILASGSYTIRASMDSLSVLMERAPLEVNLASLKQELSSIEGVIELHDLHVWSLSLGKTSMSCHITANEQIQVLREATQMCRDKYHIGNSTIQVEKPCEIHNLDCANSQKLR